MKKMTSAQELNFINSAPANSLEDYILEYSFNPVNEPAFIQRKLTSLSRLYLRKYGITEKGAIALIRTQNPDLIFALMTCDKLTYTPDSLLLENGSYLNITQWLKNHDTTKYPEKDMVWDKDQTRILHHITKHKISNFGQYDLIRRQKHEAVKAMILRGKIYQHNEFVVMQYGSKENAQLLLDIKNNIVIRRILNEMYIVRFGSYATIKQLTSTKRLHKQAEELFLEIAPFDLVVKYIKHFKLDSAQIILLKRNQPDEVLNFLSKTTLCQEAEDYLLRRNIHSEIKAYIKNHSLSSENEVLLIKHGVHREIMLYLQKQSLCDLAQLELINRGIVHEVDYMIAHYPHLADIAADRLLQIGTQEQIDIWTANIPATPEQPIETQKLINKLKESWKTLPAAC